MPLGLAMPRRHDVTRLLMTEAVTVQKWAVLPESAMAIVLGGIMDGGTYKSKN